MGSLNSKRSSVEDCPGPSSKRGRPDTVSTEPPEEAPAKVYWRTRECVQADIERHMAARAAYGKAVAWEAATESESLPPGQIEEARKRTAEAFEEMRRRTQNLLSVLPTDRRALVDLLLYLEKNFSILPQEFCGRSLAFDLLKTMRLSLRKSEGYGKS